MSTFKLPQFMSLTIALAVSAVMTIERLEAKDAGTSVTPKSSSAEVQGKSDSNKTNIDASGVEHRVLHFPKDFSLGLLRVVERIVADDKKRTVISQAKGDVTLSVPAGAVVQLELAGKIYHRPEVLASIYNEPIECFRVSYMAMDDSENEVVSNILKQLAKMKHLEIMNADRSDATDKSMAYFADNKRLRAISLFRSDIDGSFLQTLSGCTNLSDLKLWHCTLQAKNLKALSNFKNLAILNLSATQLTDEGLACVSACPNLTILRLFDNPVHDQGLTALKNLKKLKDLDLVGTKVTINGLRQLRGLHLKYIHLPLTIGTAYDAKLKTLFPGVQVIHAVVRPVSKENLDIFAPIH